MGSRGVTSWKQYLSGSLTVAQHLARELIAIFRGFRVHYHRPVQRR